MTINQSVIKELENLGSRSKVFLSMPYIKKLTPVNLENKELFFEYHSKFEPELERRHGVVAMNQAPLSPLDHGGLYGDAVFEGILIPNNQIFLFREHLKRWWKSANALEIQFPYTMEELGTWIVKAVQQVGFKKEERGYMRPVITRGFGNLGINPAKCLAPTIYVIVSTIQLYPPEKYNQGIELSVARKKRRAGKNIVNPNIKSNNYLNNISALLETRTRGTLETMMLTQQGFVAEATADNLFLVDKSKEQITIYTPSKEYCLIGLTRNLIIQEARKLGYNVVEASELLPIQFVGENKEVFMSGTGCGIMPVVGLEGVKIGNGKPGEVTQKLLDSVRNRMADPEYGLSIHADQEEIKRYLASPDKVSLDS